MTRVLLLSFLFLIKLSTYKGQIANYIINPGFEEVQTVPWHPFGHWVTGWSAIDTLKSAFSLRTLGPPFYNAPGGPGIYQYPRTGFKHLLYTYFCQDISCPDSARGYPRNRIKKELESGKVYCGQYYVNIRNASPVGIADFAMLFAGSEIDTIKYCKIPLPYLTPQISYTGSAVIDTLNWTAVSGTFVAEGHEKYLVLGNFKPNFLTQTVSIQTSTNGANFTDAYFDDVSLVEMELPAFAGRDTFMIPGDSIFLGREPDVGIDYACQWYKLPDSSVPIDTIAGFWAKPNETTTYLVRQQLWCSGVKWDTVTISISPVGLTIYDLRFTIVELKVWPNPADERIEISLQKESMDDESAFLWVSDQVGREIKKEEIIFKKGTAMLDVRDLEEGMYFLELRNNEGSAARKRIFIAR